MDVYTVILFYVCMYTSVHSTPRGILAVYMTGGGGGLTELHGEPRKIHEPEILHSKITWHQNFLPPKNPQY